MDKSSEKRLKRSFGKTFLDSPVPNRKIKFFPSGNKLKPLKSKLIKLLPEPLKPTKYVAPAPKPKPRTQKSRVSPPVPLPRSSPYAYFNSKAFTIMNSDEIIDALGKASEGIKNGVAVWLSEGSGWVIEVILGHYINIVKYVPLRGNS